MLISILIPTYEREEELRKCLSSFANHLKTIPSDEYEIIIRDNSETDVIYSLIRSHDFGFKINYKKNEYNLGAERNLLSCLTVARGEYVWFFGDDDVLAPHCKLGDIFNILTKRRPPLMLVNRAKAENTLSIITLPNYFGISEDKDIEFKSLRDVFEKWGVFSSTGFIGSNIINRALFLRDNMENYMGFNYPHIGLLCRNFTSEKVYLHTKVSVIQRDLSAKESEARARLDTVGNSDLFSSNRTKRLLQHSILLSEFLSRASLPEDIPKLLKFREYIWQNVSLGEMVFFSYAALRVQSFFNSPKIKIDKLDRLLTVNVSTKDKVLFTICGAIRFIGRKIRLGYDI
jgi:glycosyltransferase involved in cell wall biosynthesis